MGQAPSWMILTQLLLTPLMYEPKFATKTLTKRALILLIVIYHSILPRKSKNMYLHLVV